MIDSFVLALSALSSITGIKTANSIATTYDDYSNIARAIDSSVTLNILGEPSLSNVKSIDELYSINGCNQYIEVQLENGYVIYDKKTKKIVEESNEDESPYTCFGDSFKAYVPNRYDPGYLFFDGNAFQVISKNNKSTFKAGEYYTGITPKNDAVFIPNSFFFENLHNGHGNNFGDICGVVSAEILFNYLDTFCNDKIVDEKFEICATDNPWNSRNLDDFTFSPATGTNNSEDLSGQRFVNELVTICESANGKTPVGNGLYTSEQVRFVKRYLDNKGISYNMHTCIGNWADRISNRTVSFIKETIDAGRPVLSNGTGHATIAYGYDSDFVFVHTGWGFVAATPWSTYTTSMFDFAYDAGAIDIEIDNHFHSDNYYYSFLNQYLCPCGRTIERHLFTPDSYGFENQYFFYNKTKSFNFGITNIITDRKRCGYIENSFINLSARRENAGEAYLEYTINYYLRKIVTCISYWGTKEYFSQNAIIEIQYFNSSTNTWELLYNLKGQISNNRNNQTKLYLFFPEHVSRFRFYVADEAIGTYNRGRLSIGNTELIYY